MNRMRGKSAVITGAVLGIGRACALKLAEEGATVAVTDREHFAHANGHHNGDHSPCDGYLIEAEERFPRRTRAAVQENETLVRSQYGARRLTMLRAVSGFREARLLIRGAADEP